MPEKFRHFCQTLSVNGDPLDLFVDSLPLDMFSLGIPLLRGGVGFLIFHKVSFEKHSTVQERTSWDVCMIQHVYFVYLIAHFLYVLASSDLPGSSPRLGVCFFFLFLFSFLFIDA